MTRTIMSDTLAAFTVWRDRKREHPIAPIGGTIRVARTPAGPGRITIRVGGVEVRLQPADVRLLTAILQAPALDLDRQEVDADATDPLDETAP